MFPLAACVDDALRHAHGVGGKSCDSTGRACQFPCACSTGRGECPFTSGVSSSDDARDAARWRWLVKQHNTSDLPIAQVVWKRGSDPQGEWVNLIDGHDLIAHVDHATGSVGGNTCSIDQFSSRLCERGTKGCTVTHGVTADDGKREVRGVKCSNHPKAPHGYNRNASLNADRYICICEGWTPKEKS
jgi:hypothetical protein